MMMLFKCFKRKAPRKLTLENLRWVESMKVQPSKSFPVYVVTLCVWVWMAIWDSFYVTKYCVGHSVCVDQKGTAVVG